MCNNFFLIFAANLLIIALASTEFKYPIKATVVLVTPLDKQPISAFGSVVFEQASASSEITVTGQLTGLAPGNHGFHVHKIGNLTGNCVSAGPHFNPLNKTHGDRYTEPRHIGDLANVEADASGTASFEFQMPAEKMPLLGRNSIIGHTMVIHQDQDDLGLGGKNDSLSTGHAGGRLACGVIGYASDYSSCDSSDVSGSGSPYRLH